MLKIENLSFSYKRNKPLFRNLSVEMQDGGIVGLLGKNGAGKSTLLKLLAGLLFQENGKIDVNGYEPRHRHPNFLSDVYLIPEEFSLPSVSILNYLKAMAPLYPMFDIEKMNGILKEFELFPEYKLNSLSQGQRKKFLIAFALATNCNLLILDEPTNGLDIPSKSLFRKVLVSSIADSQTVLISTHQVKDVDTIIDSIIVVDKGRMIFRDSIEEIGRKYLFETHQSIDNIDGIVYSEKSPMGYRAIRTGNDFEETTIDLELLFNAITSNRLKIKN